MSFENEVLSIIGHPQSQHLEYKAVLPSSRIIAQLISSLANTDGGFIILGASENAKGDISFYGLSQDFHANGITHKAIDLLSPQPLVTYQYIQHGGKSLYVIKVNKSDTPINIEGRIYYRAGAQIKLKNPPKIEFNKEGYPKIKLIYESLEKNKPNSTESKLKILEHYHSILKLVDDLGSVLYPDSATILTTNSEGKVLTRILYSSFVDNFESYLSDLLYEIFLANPSTLKSGHQVTIEEVLNCSDLQEFVKYCAKQRLAKLQKGSVKGFIKENKQISDLNVINEVTQIEIEKFLQIRHLYSHRNGIIDEKFLQYFPGQFSLNTEHQMTIDELLDKLVYLGSIATHIDFAAIEKYKLGKSE